MEVMEMMERNGDVKECKDGGSAGETLQTSSANQLQSRGGVHGKLTIFTKNISKFYILPSYFN